MTKLFDITTPAFGGHTVRTTQIGKDTWFCAKDTFAALGMTGETVKLTKDYGIQASEARIVSKSQANLTTGKVSDFPNRGLTFINATAVRRIAQRSTKPAARAFQDFLNGTVAEAIEKDGAYVHPALAQQNPDIAKILATMKADLLKEMRKEFGETVTALTSSYDTLVKARERQERTGYMDRMPLRNYCVNSGKTLSGNQMMAYGALLSRAHVKRFGKKPDIEDTIRDGKVQASIYPLDLIREVFDPAYERLRQRREERAAA